MKNKASKQAFPWIDQSNRCILRPKRLDCLIWSEELIRGGDGEEKQGEIKTEYRFREITKTYG